MEIKKIGFLILVGCPYLIISFVYKGICFSSIESCSNGVSLSSLFYLVQISFFIAYLSFIWHFSKDSDCGSLLYVFSLLALVVFSGITTFRFLIPYECSSEILGLVIMLSIWFFIAAIAIIVGFFYYIYDKMDISRIPIRDKYYYLNFLAIGWIIACIYYLSEEKEVKNCNTKMANIVIILEIVSIIVTTILNLLAIDYNLLFFLISLIVLGVSQLVANGFGMECYTPARIVGIVPLIVVIGLSAMIFVIFTLSLVYSAFIHYIMNGNEEYNNYDILKRLEMIILDFPILCLFAKKEVPSVINPNIELPSHPELHVHPELQINLEQA